MQSPARAQIQKATILGLLAPTLGEEKSLAVWEQAIRRLGIAAADAYTPEEVSAVFESLATTPGLVGVVARFARARFDTGASVPPSSRREDDDGVAAPTSIREPPAGRIPLADVLSLLAPSLGEEKAMEVIVQVAKTLRLAPTELTRPGALAILDAMASSSGLLGVVARLGKTRFLLRYPG